MVSKSCYLLLFSFVVSMHANAFSIVSLIHATASSCLHSPSVSPPPPPPSPSVPDPSHPVSLPQQLTTLHDTQPSPRPSSQIYNHHPQFHTSRPVIVYPELANLLFHPKVDSYSDAPKVPGQLSSSSAPSLKNTDYIPCIAVNNYGAGSPGHYIDSYVPSQSHCKCKFALIQHEYTCYNYACTLSYILDKYIFKLRYCDF